MARACQRVMQEAAVLLRAVSTCCPRNTRNSRACGVEGWVHLKEHLGCGWNQTSWFNCSYMILIGAFAREVLCVLHAVLQLRAASKCWTVTAQHSHYDSMLSTLHAYGCVRWNAQTKEACNHGGWRRCRVVQGAGWLTFWVVQGAQQSGWCRVQGG